MLEPIGYGGICYYTAQLCQALLSQGIDIVLLTASGYDEPSLSVQYPVRRVFGGFDRHQPRWWRAADYLKGLGAVMCSLQDERPDVVHMQNALVSGADALLLHAIRHRKTPIVYTAHDVNRVSLYSQSALRIWANRLADRFLYHACDQIIVHTEHSRTEVVDSYGISDSQVAVVPLGNYDIHVEGYAIPEQEVARSALNIPLGNIVALFFGDRRPSKGLDLLIAASELVAQHLAEYTLLIAGEGRAADRTDYRALILRHGIMQNAVFFDHYIPLEQVPIFFAAADFVVLPYRNIYQSAIVHLAFSFGKPVVASRCGGLIEVVSDGQTGWLVDDVTNVQALADAIICAANHRDQLADMGIKAKEMEKTVYAWEEIAEQTTAVYASAISLASQLRVVP